MLLGTGSKNGARNTSRDSHVKVFLFSRLRNLVTMTMIVTEKKLTTNKQFCLNQFREYFFAQKNISFLFQLYHWHDVVAKPSLSFNIVIL